MENLKAALSEMSSTQADEMLDKMWQYARENEEYFYEEPWEFWDFVRNAAEQILGHRHGSDFYDAESAYPRAYDESDDFSHEMDLSDVKDSFGNRLLAKFAEKCDFQDIKGFDDFYKLAKKSGFDGDASAFEAALKKSVLFAERAFNCVTRYDG